MHLSPKALGPMVLSLLTFVLLVVLMAIGSYPDWQSFALVSIDTTALKTKFSAGSGSGLPIHDAYSLHLQTTCESYLVKTKGVKFVGVVCKKPSTYVKFLPLTLIQDDLTTHGSRQTTRSLDIPVEMQELFSLRHNFFLHVAFIFYVVAIASTGVGILLGGAALFNVFGPAELVGLISAVLGTLILFVASTITTAIQSSATTVINALGVPIGISAFHGSGFMSLTWCSCVTSVLATGAWLATIRREEQ